MRFVFFIVAAVVAIVVGIVVLRVNETPPPPPPVVQSEPSKEVSIKTVDILVAKADIPVGTTIDNSMVDTQPWPEHLILSGFVTTSANDGGVVGKVARSPVQAREPFIKSKLANPNDPGFLSAGLPSGMRAITIAIDSISGVAGYVFPGDRVDVLFIHGLSSDKQEGAKSSITEVVAPNIRVLAVGDRDLSSPEAGNKPPAPAPLHSVTVEVSDELVQRIRLAEKNGVLSLSLRSIHDDSSTSPNPTTLSDISKIGGGAGLMIVRGPGNAAGGKITASEGLDSNESSNSMVGH